MQIVHDLVGNYFAGFFREGIQSNGDGTSSGYIYRDTFWYHPDPETDEQHQMILEIGSQPGVLPAPCDFENYTVTVTIDITPNA